MIKRTTILTVIFLATAGWCSASEISARSEDIKSIMDNPAEFKAEKASGGKRILALFSGMREGITPEALKERGEAELKLLSEALGHVGLFRGDKEVAAAHENVFRELESRGLASREAAGYLQLAYIDARMFGEARELFEKYPQYDLNFIPEVNDAGGTSTGRKVFAIDPKLARINAAAVPELDKGAKVLFVGSIFCNISANSVNFIEGNEQLRSLAGSFTALSNNFAPKQLAKWNEEHAVKFMLPYDRAEWKDFDLSRTPGVYMLRDGKVVYQLDGWDIFGGARLAEGLFRIGLLDFDGYVSALKYSAEALYAAGESFEDRVSAGREIRALLAPNVKKSALRRASLKTLETAFYLSADALINGSSLAPLEEISRLFSEMERRGKVKKDIAENLYDYYLDSREFKAAARLAKKHPEFKYSPVPEIVRNKRTAAAHRVYEVDAGGRRAEVKTLDPWAGPRIIVTGVPGCGATKRAFADIEKQPELKELFARNGLFITWNSYFGSVAAWNEKHSTKAYVAYLRSDWPELAVYSSPVFYFFKDGKLMETSRGGWGDAAGMAEKLKGLNSIGLKWEFEKHPASAAE